MSLESRKLLPPFSRRTVRHLDCSRPLLLSPSPMPAFPFRAHPLCRRFCRRNPATRVVKDCCRRSGNWRISCQRMDGHGEIPTYRNVSPASLFALPCLIIFDAVDQSLQIGMPFFQRQSFLRKPLACETIFGTCTESACRRSVDRARHQHVNEPSVSCSPVIEEFHGWQCAVCSPLFAAGQAVVFFTGFRRDLVSGHAIRSYCACSTKSETKA